MASPSLSPYATNGPVKTGRMAMNGDYANASIRAKSVANGIYGELCAGYAWFSGLKTIEVIPIVTWEDYPTGIVDIPITSGHPTSGAPAAIYNSYNEGWIASQGVLSPHATIHAPELRYYCLIYSSSTRMIVWMSSGSGHDTTTQYIAPDTLTTYTPAKSFDITASFTLNIDVNCHERVDIEQLTSSGDWVWPADTFTDGMGTTHATFDAVADETVSSLTIGGDTIAYGDMPSGFIPTLTYNPFSSSRTIEGKAGLYTTAVGTFGWGSTGFIPYRYVNASVFSSLTEVSTMTIGVREMDLNFHDGVSYQGTDTNCEGNASGNSFNYLAKNSPASASGASVYTHAVWTNLGISYKHIVDFTMMDGAAQSDPGSTAPSFTDIASGITWTGNTSPLIVFDGVWTLDMYELDGSIMDSYSPETDHSGSGAHWSRLNPAPEYISLKLNNPEAYNDTASGSIDDRRVQMVYPREGEVLSWALTSSTELDALDTIGTAGVGGWNAVNCTLSVVGGNLTVTTSTSGGYIYRSDFMIDSDIRQPKHWPGHRFAKITATGLDGGSAVIPFVLTIGVKRTGGADTMSKAFSPVMLTDDTFGIFDICHPDSSGSVDTANSYIDAALPLDTIIESSVRASNELSALSWSWGIGCFDRIEISGFVAGNTYTLSDLSTIYLDPYVAANAVTNYGQVTYVQGECNAWRNVGATAITEYPEDSWDNEVYRHIIGVVNGRYAWEAPSVKVSKSPHYAVDLYSNYSIKQVFAEANNRWPVDDFSAYTFTPSADYVDCWDAGLGEYTSESMLWAADVCPIWFCLTKRSDGEHDNSHDGIIKAAPLYDNVTVYPSWGDGTGVTARTGWVTLRSVKRVRGRVNGIAWHSGLTPYDSAIPDSLANYYSIRETDSSGIEYNTDSMGYYRTGDVKKPAAIWPGGGASPISLPVIKNRQWYRACFDLALGGWLRYNPATGELIYTVYPEPGSLSACTQPST